MPWRSPCARRSSTDALQLPRFWIALQVAIVVFVLIGAIIAIVKLS